MSTSPAVEGITLGMEKETVEACLRLDVPILVIGTEVHVYGLYGGIVGGLVVALVVEHIPSISSFSSFTLAIISTHPAIDALHSNMKFCYCNGTKLTLCIGLSICQTRQIAAAGQEQNKESTGNHLQSD